MSFNNFKKIFIALLLLTINLTILFDTNIFAANTTFSPANTEITFQLPIPVGSKNYIMTSGAHGYGADCFNSGSPTTAACKSHKTGWSALDIGTTDKVGIVTAMASGIAYIRSACEVGIQHANGYITRYTHLARIKIGEGQIVNEGDVLGEYDKNTLSCGYGTGGHLHVSIWSNKTGIPVQLNIYDFKIGNYLPQESESQYLGCIVHVPTQKKYCPGDFYSNGNAWLLNVVEFSNNPVTIPVTIASVNTNINTKTTKQIRRRGTNQCMNASIPKNNSKLDTYTCNVDSKEQQFELEDVGNNQIMIKSNTGYCVNAFKPKNYKKINMFICSKSDKDLKFYYQNQTLRSINPGNQCINSINPSNNNSLTTITCNNNDINQLWEVI